MDISSEELFESAMNGVEPEAPEQVAESESQVNRDEQGRFAPKSEEAEVKPEATQEVKSPVELKEEANVPSWRLKEIREERDALRQQNAELQRRFLASQPRPEPAVRPDILEDPDGAIKSVASEMLTPIEQQFASFIETVSRKDAVREHGQERVSEAFSALDQASKAGDPQAIAIVQSVKKSMDPFGDIVNWYRGAEASRNPEGFFQRKLDEALKDDKFKDELLAKLQPVAEEKPKPVFNVPPSLGRAAAAASSLREGGDLSNESLFENAMR